MRHFFLVVVVHSIVALELLSFLALTANSGESANGASARPNVVVILSDDQGWGDLSLNGNKTLSTPNIDALASGGAMFDRFYVCPVCSPTRAEFLTGRYHPRGNIYSTSAGGERLDLDEVTIADTFKAAGYATAAFGKWHNGMQYPYHPVGRGFDEFYGFCSGHWGNYFGPQLEHNGKLVQGEGFVVDDFTNHAIEFIRKQSKSETPFFVYLPYNTPHSPMQVPDEYWDRFKNKEIQQSQQIKRNKPKQQEDFNFTRCALAMCENIDWNVGRIVQELESLQIADNTIVVYFCDNGPNSNRWNGGMRGRKGSTDEGGVRSPLIIRWPDEIHEGTEVRKLGAAIDLLPTLADLAGIDLISKKQIDGLSLKPLLKNSADGSVAAAWPDRTIFSHWNHKVSACNMKFRLDHEGNLYDMQEDPGQRKPVNELFPDIAKSLKRQVATWSATTLAEMDREPRPFLIGHEQFRFTQLPARDATATGNIQRSNRYPNSSYFLNWTSTEEEITWPVHVSAAGDYDVQLWYACKETDTGVVLRLSLGDSTVSATVETAHEPLLLGAEHDRVPRNESYIKNFKSMSMGTIRLAAGSGKLKLNATQISGSEAIEFRLLMFTRLETVD